MTAVTSAHGRRRAATEAGSAAGQPRGRGRVHRAVRDTLVVARRNLRVLVRKPALIIPAIVQPVVFLLLFKYVFGGVIGAATQPTGIAYIDQLVPAAIFITAAFGMATTATGIASDMSAGMVDRFRSLPMSQAAFLAGRVVADTIKAALAVVLITVVGVALGFRPEGDVGSLAVAFVLALGFGFAFSWLATWIGTLISSPESAIAATLLWLFPLVFASSAFVPPDTFPWALRTFAKANPITHFVDAIRVLTLDVKAGTLTVPAQHPVALSVGWLALLTLVFSSLAARAYARST
jgi:ABC transporter DrrB family efflux protein